MAISAAFGSVYGTLDADGNRNAMNVDGGLNMNAAKITNVGSIAMLHGNTVVADKVQNQLEVKVNGTVEASYDGNAAKSVNISRVSKAVSTDKLKTARTINNVQFDGQQDITITQVQDAHCATSARSADKLKNTRTTNGVAFDSSSNITIAQVQNANYATSAEPPPAQEQPTN